MDRDQKQKIEALMDAASLCNDELGEYWNALASLARHVADNDKFAEEYWEWVDYEYGRLVEEFSIVETELVQDPIPIRRLVHFSEFPEPP